MTISCPDEITCVTVYVRKSLRIQFPFVYTEQGTEFPLFLFYSPPQRSWGKVMFLQACVILFTGGGSASVHAGIPSPPGSRHPQEQTPQEDAPPQSRLPGNRHPPQSSHPPGADPPPQSMLGDTVNARAVRILLECNLVPGIVISLTNMFKIYFLIITFIKVHASWRLSKS